MVDKIPNKPWSGKQYPRTIPYLTVQGADKAIDFYTSVLGYTEHVRIPGPGGSVGHAELELGDSIIMLAEESPEMGSIGPKTVGGTPVNIAVYVDDVDGTHKKALAEGAKELRPPEDQFYGDRASQIEDPFGHKWSLMMHVRDVSEEEMGKAVEQMIKDAGG